jgi:hypothetical protein
MRLGMEARTIYGHINNSSSGASVICAEICVKQNGDGRSVIRPEKRETLSASTIDGRE